MALRCFTGAHFGLITAIMNNKAAFLLIFSEQAAIGSLPFVFLLLHIKK